MFKVNFTNVDVGTMEALPNGWYHVAVTDCEVKKAGENAKNPGSDYISYEMTVQEGEHKNKKLWANASLLPQALFTLKGMMIASGKWTTEQLSGELNFQPSDLLGAQFLARNVQREWNGDMTNNIKSYKPLEGSGTGNITTVKDSNSNLLP